MATRPDLPPAWKWLARAAPPAPLPSRVPSRVLSALEYKRCDSPIKRASGASMVFWSARQPPALSLLPRLIRLTAYGAVPQPALAGFLAEASAHPWLQSLTVMFSDLSDICDEVGLLRGLYDLSFEKNKIRSLPAAVGALDRLEELDLSGNPIEGIDEAIGGMEKLHTLSLGGAAYEQAPLQRLPSSLAALPSLAKLSLLWLPSLSTQLGSLGSLTALALHGQVSPAGLPPELGSLVGLRSLALHESTLTSVPEAIRGLRELQTLYLTEGAFTSLPSWLPELDKLEYLAIHGSEHIPADELVSLVARMPSLRRVFLWYKFPPEARKKLQKLGFQTNKSNPSSLHREGGDTLSDPFTEIR